MSTTEVVSVPCNRCGWPSLSYQCFTECRDEWGRNRCDPVEKPSVDTAALSDADVTLALVVDGYEKQRTKAYRTLNAETLRLIDARIALRDGAVHVVAEFLDRAIAACWATRDDLRHAPDTK